MKLFLVFVICAYVVESKPFLNPIFGFKRTLNTKESVATKKNVDFDCARFAIPWGAAKQTIGMHLQTVRNTPKPIQALGIVSVVLGVFSIWLNKVLWTPSRKYDQEKNSVGQEYDAWEQEGILEHYWGEHIHLGYYEESARPPFALLPPRKNFIQAKFDFIEEMLRFGRTHPEQLAEQTSDPTTDVEELDSSLNATSHSTPEKFRILDVGCGIGGTSRYLAKRFGESASVVGITLSGNQAKRAATLAQEQNVTNAEFRVMDALAMDFPDNSFDLVWACESGEHMPDKKRYVEEMTRVLKPGGRIVVATWCQRDEGGRPFDKKERRMLDFLYSEWTHPYFISISDYANLMRGTGRLLNVETADWTAPTIASWLHSIWVGVFDPWPVFRQPRLYYKCFRDGLTLVRMHQSFQSKLMQYGMMTAKKSDKLCN